MYECNKVMRCSNQDIVRYALGSFERLLSDDKLKTIDMDAIFQFHVRLEAIQRLGEGKVVICPSVEIEEIRQPCRWPADALPNSLQGVKFTFFPISYKDHWILVVLGGLPRSPHLVVYDSYKTWSTHFDDAVTQLNTWLAERFQLRMGRTGWNAKCTQQDPKSLDCGAYFWGTAPSAVHTSMDT
jgi:hypothetical protein